MADGGFSKFKSTFAKGVSSVNTKLEVSKLKGDIADIEKEIVTVKTEIGDLVFMQWQADSLDADLLDAKCVKIQSYQQDIDKINAEIELLIQSSAQEISADKKEAESEASTAEPTEIYKCPNCGAEYTTKVNFCMKCGAKAEEDTATQSVE